LRLDKFICKSSELTKEEAIQNIHAGNILVNGIIFLEESVQVHENNSITLCGKALILRPFRYILMHKPAGVICSNNDGDYPSLFKLLDINKKSELHIAGRLDVDTTGLVLITDDGRWTYNITRPDKECKKEYRVGLSYAISNKKIEELIVSFKNGLQLQGEKQPTLPAFLKLISSSNSIYDINRKEILLTITEGRYHQVKRMFAAVGNRVLTLHRQKIGSIQLDVDVGKWRYLTEDEVNSFK
jgi:16S rRNA pseudouridine516 synthase